MIQWRDLIGTVAFVLALVFVLCLAWCTRRPPPPPPEVRPAFGGYVATCCGPRLNLPSPTTVRERPR